MANQESPLLHKPLSSSSSSSSSVEVVMVPFPAQSHLNQLLQLSHIISSYNIKVHYVGWALHVSQAKSRAANQTLNPNIEFHSFPTPEFPFPQPSNTKFPSHLMPCFEATVHLREPMRSLLSLLSETTKRLVIVHDTLMSHVVQDGSSLQNAEPYFFHCISALYRFSFHSDGLGVLKIKEDIPSPDGILYPEFRDFLKRYSEFRKTNKKAGVLYNTCRVLEGEILDFLSEKESENSGNKSKTWAVGPLETVTMFKNKTSSTRKHKCLEWLDEQEPNSVLYVSFGTTTFMRDDQIEELAKGLEQSGNKFIWILRDADKGDIFDTSEVRRPKLPLGFEERVEAVGIGMVVTEWAPQLEILGHSSTGGFMSHCGWNSCLESLTLGVPLGAWPMHSDQPTNAFLVTQVLKAGLVVREWVKRDELVISLVISEVIKRLMSSDEGEEIRKRAEELGRELSKCIEQGGVSRLELDSFVAHITRA